MPKGPTEISKPEDKLPTSNTPSVRESISSTGAPTQSLDPKFAMEMLNKKRLDELRLKEQLQNRMIQGQ